MNKTYTRHISFEEVLNFRDLGGYRTQDGRSIAWRCLFRSGELRQMTDSDTEKLMQEIGLKTVIDLRSSHELKEHGIGMLTENGIHHHSIPLLSEAGDREKRRERLKEISNMGEFYSILIRGEGFSGRVISAFEIIADSESHPLVFHCTLGKDRTGILAAMLLKLLNVDEEDIINDYAMTADFIEELIESIRKDTEKTGFGRNLPSYFLESTHESMSLFLKKIEEEYGSVKEYLKEGGLDDSLVTRLEDVLLE